MRYYSVAAFMAVSLIIGCGVRGRPQPPATPAELGHGQPNFKRASEEFAIPDVPAPEVLPTPVPRIKSGTRSSERSKSQSQPSDY